LSGALASQKAAGNRTLKVIFRCRAETGLVIITSVIAKNLQHKN